MITYIMLVLKSLSVFICGWKEISMTADVILPQNVSENNYLCLYSRYSVTPQDGATILLGLL